MNIVITYTTQEASCGGIMKMAEHSAALEK